MTVQSSDRHLVDRFVERVNREPRERKFLHEVPIPCRRAIVGVEDCVDWQIVRSENAMWVANLERRLGIRFPEAFRELVSGYLFPSFACGDVMFYAVGREGIEDGSSLDAAESVILSDRALCEFLLARHLIPFARPTDGDYDAICFDRRTSSSLNDAPIVRIDHEAIFLGNRLRTGATLAQSFDDLLVAFLASRL